MRVIRYIAFSIMALLALLFAWAALTVPMFAATTPTLITIALIVAMYFTWPKHA